MQTEDEPFEIPEYPTLKRAGIECPAALVRHYELTHPGEIQRSPPAPPTLRCPPGKKAAARMEAAQRSQVRQQVIPATIAMVPA